MKYFAIVSLLLILIGSSAMAAGGGEEAAESPVKIGFLVKMPEQSWFQDEWKFALEAAAEHGFEVIEIGAADGQKTLDAIENIAAQGAGGFVICTPDVKLGPAIMSRAEAHGMKVFTVDDRFVDASGKAMEEVPHMGISAYEIGKQVGYTLYEQMNERGWDQSTTGFMRISFDELPTAKDRTAGMTDAIIEMGFDSQYIFDSPQKTTDVEGAFNAANITISKNPQITRWLISGLNDDTAVGGTRAAESNGFPVENVVAVGIGGDRIGTSEFEKENLTSFYATALISPKRHGYETAEFLYRWISEGIEPPALTLTSAVMMDRTNYVEKLKENGLWKES